MDLAQLAPWLGGALTALGALAALFREKAKRAALQAELALEQERQETTAQGHALRRLETLEGRVDTQAQLIADLHDENSRLRTKLADQDQVIRRQATMIGDLHRANRQLSEQARQKERDNAALAAEMADLRRIIHSSRDKPSGLPADLYEPLPKPPKLPRT